VVAAALTWILPAGQYDRRDDAATGKRVVVPGTYHRVPAAPVGPFAAAVAIPRGLVAAADVIAVVLFVGGAWVVVDRLGALSAIVGAIVGAFSERGLWIVPAVATFFAVMGALENMQEEIIALVPALMVLGAGIGVDGVVVVAMSGGAAMVGSAFGPTNPFQAGMALRLAQLPAMAGAGLRFAMFIIGLVLWIAWTIRHAAASNPDSREARVGRVTRDLHVAGRERGASTGGWPSTSRHAVILAIALAPMAAYVYGAIRLDWGFNELSGAFVIGTVAAGLVGGLGIGNTIRAYLEGMQVLLPAALMVGVARSISLVLEDGRVIDTILAGFVASLARMAPLAAAGLMVPIQAAIHVAVPSVSGQAVLTMPLVVPLADVLGLSRQVPVLAYQTGAGLCELVTPTNGALMAILLAASVPFQRWLRFAAGGVVLLALIGLASLAFAR
jgi:uncharacterized ion transporter superfamily protein YfcC